METRASYTLVGTFVLVLMVGLAGFVIWLAKFSSDVQYDEYQIYFAGSVTGLSPAATVSYRGIPVGHVTGIEIDPKDIDKVLVTIQVASTTPVRTDTVASIEMQGITGVAYVQLTGGSDSAPDLEPAAGQEVAVITAANSALDQVFKSAPDMINSAIQLMNRGSALLSDDNLASISATLASVSQVTGEIANHKDDLGALIDDARATLANVQSTTASIDKVAGDLSANLAGLIGQASDTLATLRNTLQTANTTIGNADQTIANAEPDIRATLDDLRKAAASIRATADTAQALLEENRAPINDFAQNGLYDISEFIADARALVLSLTQIAVQLERDPAGFLFGGNQSGYQAP